MAPLDRTEKFQMRLTADEKRMLESIAEIEGLSASDLIRQHIRQRWAALTTPRPEVTKRLQEAFGSAPKRSPAKKKK